MLLLLQKRWSDLGPSATSPTDYRVADGSPTDYRVADGSPTDYRVAHGSPTDYRVADGSPTIGPPATRNVSRDHPTWMLPYRDWRVW
jgi:hypothetical protein